MPNIHKEIVRVLHIQFEVWGFCPMEIVVDTTAVDILEMDSSIYMIDV